MPTIVLLTALSLAAGDDTQQATRPIDLRLLFVGTQQDVREAHGRAARSRDFVTFLAREFANVRAADREHFDPAIVGDADVVLLDWSQQEVDLQDMAKLTSPLGPRSAWHHPTVLLGSAGLLIASPWETQGAHG